MASVPSEGLNYQVVGLWRTWPVRTEVECDSCRVMSTRTREDGVCLRFVRVHFIWTYNSDTNDILLGRVLVEILKQKCTASRGFFSRNCLWIEGARGMKRERSSTEKKHLQIIPICTPWRIKYLMQLIYFWTSYQHKVHYYNSTTRRPVLCTVRVPVPQWYNNVTDGITINGTHWGSWKMSAPDDNH